MSGASSSFSRLMCTKNKRTATASRMPTTPQTIHAGKYDPRILNEGAREHPAASSVPAKDAPITATRSSRRPNGEHKLLVGLSAGLGFIFFVGIGSWAFGMQQVPRLEGQRSDPSQQLSASSDIRGACRSEGALCRDHVDLAAHAVVVRLQCRVVVRRRGLEQSSRRFLLTERGARGGVRGPYFVFHLIAYCVDFGGSLFLIGLGFRNSILAGEPIEKGPGQAQSRIPELLVFGIDTR